MQDHPADQLNVEMAHVKYALADLAHNSKGLGEDRAKKFLLGLVKFFGSLLDLYRQAIFLFLLGGLIELLLETFDLLALILDGLRVGFPVFRCLRAQFIVAHRADTLLKRVDLRDIARELLDQPDRRQRQIVVKNDIHLRLKLINILLRTLDRLVFDK